MRYLLDTVAAIRWWTEPARLGAQALPVLEQGDTRIFLSAVSVWEIANKNRIGKLNEVDDFAGQLPNLWRRSGFSLLELSADHALRAGYLPGPHRDPFDRLLAGQALAEDMTVLTNDAEFAAFGCRTLW